MLICPLLIGLGSAVAQSQYHSPSEEVSHYLGFSLGAGDANTILRSDKFELTDSIGFGTQFSFLYEVRKQSFFFNIGVSAQATLTRQHTDFFADTLYLRDPKEKNDPFLARLGLRLDSAYYLLQYRDYNEAQHTLLVGVPIQFGYYIIPELYVAVGARVEYQLMSHTKTRTSLQTRAFWDCMEREIVASDGVDVEKNKTYVYSVFPYSMDPATDSLQYEIARGEYMKDLSPLHKFVVSPTLEVGTSFKLSKKTELRLAAYAEYAIPLFVQRKPIVEYATEHGSIADNYPCPYYYYNNASDMGKYDFPITTNKLEMQEMAAYLNTLVDQGVLTQVKSRQQLWDNLLKVNSLLDHDAQRHRYGRLSVGIRATILFDLRSKPRCTTCTDDSGIRYTVPRSSRKTPPTKRSRDW